MMKIPLSQGLFAIVSDEDYVRVSQYKWTASNESRGRKKWYAVRYLPWADGKRKKIRMSRFVMDLADGDLRVVDHIDGDGLDNRRENLEVVYQDENMRRAKGWHVHKPKPHSARKPNNKKSKREKVSSDSEGNDSDPLQGTLV